MEGVEFDGGLVPGVGVEGVGVEGVEFDGVGAGVGTVPQMPPSHEGTIDVLQRSLQSGVNRLSVPFQSFCTRRSHNAQGIMGTGIGIMTSHRG